MTTEPSQVRGHTMNELTNSSDSYAVQCFTDEPEKMRLLEDILGEIDVSDSEQHND